MKPFFCRVGNKTPIVPKLLKLIPEHRTYVEAFVGSGALLLAKEPSEVEVINDLDKSVVENFRLLKGANPDPDDYHLRDGVPAIQRFVNSTPHTREDKILRNLYISCNTFSSKGVGKIYKPFSGSNKIGRINEYIERMQGVKIYNADYKSIIDKYDSSSTFFFLDPPYENSKGLYKEFEFDYEELRDILKHIKGKVMLTLNDSGNIRRIFKDFIVKGITIKSTKNISNAIGSKDRKEVIIMNYRLP